ncbi:MAG TPA: FAD-binding protein [Gammaproteobacteria bacterium]|nr:FAD-binding protein [Gammaproteobacteria bacterium]
MKPRVLVIAEHAGGALNASTAKCVSCALELDPESVTVAVLEAGAAVAEQAALVAGVTKVVHVSATAGGAAPLAATLAPQIAALAAGYSHVLAPSTTFGKDGLPRAAALLGVSQVSDVMSVLGPYLFKRPIYAGNAIVTVEAHPDLPLVATVRTASYAAAGAASSPAPIETANPDVELPTHTRFVRADTAAAERPDLQTAARVVSGGRALGSAEGFKLIYELADALGAAVGASRAAVDSAFVANDLQVGQTGKIIAPELYVAVGISGAIQHLTGIKDARTIVAINKDPDAPIFEVADFGLVADLFSAVPELLAALRAPRA